MSIDPIQKLKPCLPTRPNNQQKTTTITALQAAPVREVIIIYLKH
jgi:hypothetical protein